MNRRQLLYIGIAGAAYHICNSAPPLLGEAQSCPPRESLDPEQQEYVERVTAAENDRENRLLRYFAREKYTVYRRGRSDPDATRVLDVLYVKGEGKTYTEIERHGKAKVQIVLLDELIKQQEELSKPENRKRALITLDNYEMRLACKAVRNKRQCAALALNPRRPSKYVVQGNVWVDQNTCHLVQVDGTLAARPTVWASKPKITREYSDRHGFALADCANSTAPSLIFGETQVVILYTYTDSSIRVQSRPISTRTYIPGKVELKKAQV